MNTEEYENWLMECASLVRHETVWRLLVNEGEWRSAWEAGFTPTQAVRVTMLDVLAPRVGEVTWP